MKSIFLSREQVFEKPLPLLRALGASAPAGDLVRLTVTDDGFAVDGGRVNWYLEGETCADRFGRENECAVCAVRPVLLLEPGEEMTVDVEFKFAGCAAGDGVICGDPRFNHAPENWFKCSDVSEQGWIDNCGAKDRDGDIFMATSDAGYLQSKYELAFLPAIAALKGNGGLSGRLYSPSRYDGTRGFPQSIGDCANGEFMWTTYSPYAAYRDDSAAFDDLNIVGGGGGFRVNPYSDTTNVILSVFLNTPLDWRYAATNDTQFLRDSGVLNMKAKEFNEDYAWNSYGAEDAQIDWEDFETRCAILKTKAEMLGKTIGDKTVEFLADNFRNNIRDLEGKLNQVLALSDLRGISPDDLIDEGMIVPPQEEVKRRSISPKQVVEKVAKYYDLTSKDLYGTSRVKNIKNARQIAMFLLKDQLNLSTVRIGQEFSKDHTTIMHGIKVIETALKTDFNLRQQITDLRGKINAD